MIEAVLMLMLVITSAGVFVMCMIEIILALKDKISYEKRMRHRRANKK